MFGAHGAREMAYEVPRGREASTDTESQRKAVRLGAKFGSLFLETDISPESRRRDGSLGFAALASSSHLSDIA